MSVRLPAALLLTALIAWGLDRALPSGELRDYGSFIASGRARAQELNPYGIYPPLTFHVVLPGFEVWNPNLNPPISVPVFAWFDTVDPHRGFRLWWIVSLLSYVAAVGLLMRRYGGRRSWLLPLWAMSLAGFWDTLALGQIYLPLVLAAAAAWVLLDSGRTLPAGILLGIVVAVKPNFAVWPALLLLAGHWWPAAIAATTALALSAVPLATHGVEIYAQWLALILSDAGRAGFLTNASLLGLFDRLGIGGAAAVVSVSTLAALGVWAARRRPAVLPASAFGILGGILASPIAWVHYTLFLLPVFFSMRLSPALLASAVLLVVPVPLILRLLDAPLWQQVTAGSVYNWGVLLCSAGLLSRRMKTAMHGRPSPLTIVFYDGVCGLCDHFIYFLLARDRHALLRFAPLQGALAQRELVPAGFDPADLDSVLVIAGAGTPEQRVLARSRAVLHALSRLGGGWALVARAAAIIPARLADRVYDLLARRRYRWFGRMDACPMPRPEWRNRFIDEVVTDG